LNLRYNLFEKIRSMPSISFITHRLIMWATVN